MKLKTVFKLALLGGIAGWIYADGINDGIELASKDNEEKK